MSAETWERANAILGQQAASRPPARKAEYLFSGLTRCACGHPMYVKLPSPKYLCRKCNRKIVMDDLEAIFRHELQSFFLSDDELRAFLDREDHEIREKEELIRVLETEGRKLALEAEKVYRAYIDNHLTPKEFGDLHRPLKERGVQIEDQVLALTAEIDLRRINRLSSGEVIAEARDLYGQWEKLSFTEKRTIVEAIVDEIIIGDTIEISLSYLPQLPSGTDGKKATHQHGFIAAASIMRAG